MALAASTSSAGQTITLAAGSHTGHILVSHTGCTVQGAGMGETIVVLDGTYSEGVRPGASVAEFTLKDLTIDCGALAGVTVGLEIVAGAIAQMTAENVEIIDHKRGAIAVYNRGVFRGTNLRIIGNGAGILHHGAATECTIRGCDFEGGQYGFTNTSGVGIDLDDFTWVGDYWQAPTYETVTATAYADLYADVSSHAEANRTAGDIIRHLSPVATFNAANALHSASVQVHDRIEIDGVAWSRVLADNGDGTWTIDDWRAWGKWRKLDDAPSGVATVYRVTLARWLTGTATRLALQVGGATPPAPRWRHPDGSQAATPTVATGTRLDIIRVGGASNDTDTGGIHFTEVSIDARVTNAYVRGCRSDCITLRGTGTVAERCVAELGYDMGFTVDGTDDRVTLTQCYATKSGRTGFHVTGGPCDLYACSAVDNGTINDGSGDYGCAVQESAPGCRIEMVGSGNLDALVAGLIDEPTHVATPTTGGPPYPFALVSPFWRTT